MSEAYEEILEGETHRRREPGERHELICARLHALVTHALAGHGAAELLPPRSIVQTSPGTLLRPDLALVTTVGKRIWLIAEIVDAGDHRLDTVVKKDVYEGFGLPRLWMVDPRYNNVEIYHGTPHGLALRGILAGQETLSEQLLPRLQLTMNTLFAT